MGTVYDVLYCQFLNSRRTLVDKSTIHIECSHVDFLKYLYMYGRKITRGLYATSLT